VSEAPNEQEPLEEEFEEEFEDELDDELEGEEELAVPEEDVEEEEADAGGSSKYRRTRRPRKERPAGAPTVRPIVAVVGRPNVGKSTLFNRLARANIAIVEDRPGVTRDRHYADAEALGIPFVLIDTGGFDPESDDPMQEGIARQVKLALEEADLLVCVLDATVEPLEADREAVQLLRRSKKPVLYVANKCDSQRRIQEATHLYELGIDHLIPVSSLHGLGLGDVEEAVAKNLPPPKPIQELGYDDAPRIAIIGRPNAGKSSLVNRLLGEDRQLVDARPGTTVDSIDALLEKGGKRYILIDTAGIRRKRAKKESIEELAIMQAIRAMERCELVVLMIDASEGVAEQDAKIAGLAADRGRAMVIVLNKMDLLDKDEQLKAIERTREILNFVAWAPIVRLSTLTGRGQRTLLETIENAIESFAKRVSTAELNRFFEQVLAHHPPPPQSGHSVRLYYLTQAQVEPPTFIAMTNHPDYVHFSYKRYLANQLRKRFAFEGVPVRVVYRKKKNRRGPRPAAEH
jgi:GTP-binding protein